MRAGPEAGAGPGAPVRAAIGRCAPYPWSRFRRAALSPLHPPPLALVAPALEEAAARALPLWAAGPASARVPRVHRGPLSRFPAPDEAARAAETTASVIAPCRGVPPATVLLGLDPEDALRVVRRRSAVAREPALEDFRRASAALLAALAAAVGRPDVDTARARLSEDSLVATVLATHPPPGTGLLSVSLRLDLGGDPIAATLLLFGPPKGLPPASAGSEVASA